MSWYASTQWGGDAEGWTGAALATTLAWNTSAPIGGAQTFSNGNRTVVFTAGEVIVPLYSAIAGKQLLAITTDSVVNFMNFGFYCPNATPTNGMGHDATTLGWFNNTTNNFTSAGNLAGWSDGVTIGLVVDKPNNRAWITDGTNYVGTATTDLAGVNAGTSSVSLGSLATDPAGLYFAIGKAFGSGGGQVTLLTSWPGGWGTPTGYTYPT